MGSPEDLKMDVAGVCKWCGVKLTESPLLSCEEMKVVKWQQLIRDDLYGSTSKSVIHSLSCGELGVRTEAMTVLCSQLLPHFCADDACLESQDSFPTKIESVIKSTGRSVCDLLSQQKLDDATAELEFLHHCVNMLLQCAQSNLDLSAALGFQLCCLPCLSHLLIFCRDTERDGVLQSLSPLLASLFKTSFSLLKLCLEGTEHVTVDHTHLTHLLSMLNQLAEVALTFDPSLILLCWKFLAKFVCRTKSQLTDIMQTISPIIQQLCIAMETKSRECVMSVCETGGQVFGKLLKLCRFLSTLLVKMISEFEEVVLDRMLSQQLLQMVINVQAAVVRSSCHGNHWREFESNILLLREPLIQALLHSTNFINQLLDEELVGEGGHAAWALCLCTLTKLFPTLNEGVQDDIMGERTSREEDGHTCMLIDALFSALHKSYVNVASGVRVGGVMCNGQPQRMVTLYEHILSHISCLILCLPTRHRPKMEHVLVGYLFFDDAHCSTMAADAFVFLSRQAGPDATLVHTHHLCTLLSSLPGGHWQLSSVIHRLVFLLPPSHIQRLSTTFGVEQFPVVSAHLSSTGHLDASQLHQYLLQRLTTQISSQAPDLFALSTTLESLVWAVCGMKSVPPTLSSLPDQLLLVLTSLPLSSQLSSEVAAMVLHLLSHLLSSSPSPLSLLPLFQALRQFLSLHPLPQPLALAMPLLLQHCSQLMVPQQVQSEVLGVVAAAFHLLLSHHSWLVQTLTLEAFRNFAELTPYPTVGEKCIPKDLSSHVVNFLQKVPYGRESIDSQQIQSILRQHQRPQATPSASETTPPPTNRLDELLNAWDSVSQVRGPSPWLLNQLKQLCSQIQIYLSQHTCT